MTRSEKARLLLVAVKNDDVEAWNELRGDSGVPFDVACAYARKLGAIA